MTLPRRSAQSSPTETPAVASADAAPRRVAKPRAATRQARRRAARRRAGRRRDRTEAAAHAATRSRDARAVAGCGRRAGGATPRRLDIGVPRPGVARPAPRCPQDRAPRAAGALPPAHIPPEALASPAPDRLLVGALVASLVLHGIALAIHFSPIDLRSLADKGPPLEVALVNARSPNKPTKADILAQANLDGGGNTDQNRRAKTPLPVLPKESAAERRVDREPEGRRRSSSRRASC